MNRVIFAISLLGIAGGLSLYAQQSPAPASAAPPQAATRNPPSPADYKIPPEASAKTNPARPTAVSIASGKKAYGFDCAMCHGDTGDGKGDLATDMKLTIPDLRDPATLKNFTDGDLYFIISTGGKPPMQPEADRRKPEEMWSMVNYIRLLSKETAKHKPAAN